MSIAVQRVRKPEKIILTGLTKYKLKMTAFLLKSNYCLIFEPQNWSQ